MAYGTNAQRLAFTPSVPTPASGPSQAYIWYETDTTDTYAYASGAWHKVNTTGGLANAATFQNSGGDASGTTYDGSAARTIGPDTFGLGTASSPQFAGINLGAASDTTLTRVSAGVMAVEGNTVYAAGGTDVPVADGGTGSSTAAGAATNLGLGTGDSPQFTAVNIGHATDTTITRTGAGDIAVEGNALYRAGGTDVPVADGGTGASTAAGARTNLGITNTYEVGPPTPPTTADLATWDNQGTSTATDGTDALILKPQVDQALHGRYKAAPGTPYDVYCRVNHHSLSTAAITASVVMFSGILFKDTGGDNERLAFGILHERISGDEQNNYSLAIQRYTGASPPVFSATPVQKYSLSPWQWIRVNNDGTTLTFYGSMDGKNWITAGTETLAAFIDGAASYGVFSIANSNCTEMAAIFSYFSTTAPS